MNNNDTFFTTKESGVQAKLQFREPGQDKWAGVASTTETKEAKIV